jgi:hypothetical protein
MMQDRPRGTGFGLMNLVTGILDDAKLLMRQEAQLLRDEVKLEVGALFLLLMLVHGLHEWMGLPLWGSYGVVGGMLAGVGLTLILRARSLAGTVHTTPRRSLHTMKENVQWIKERMTLKRI